MTSLLLCLVTLFALAIISSHAQDHIAGFISIDCGVPLDPGLQQDSVTYIPYSTDEDYITSGFSNNTDQRYKDNAHKHFWTVRSFPIGTRNCYNLTSARAKGKTYLIRASFMYGNYDGKNQTTTFDLHLGVELWDTVVVNDSASIITKEIIYIPSSDYLYVCLVNVAKGTPFISVLELRPLNQSSYQTDEPGDSLLTHVRLNYAPAYPSRVIRYPDDIYDRQWQPHNMSESLVALSTTERIEEDNSFKCFSPPQAVMQTAVTTPNVTIPLNVLSWTPPDSNVPFYAYMHFAEIAVLQSNESRAFTIKLGGNPWYNGIVVPEKLSLFTANVSREVSQTNFNFSIEAEKNSSLPPLLNAVEVYSIKRFAQSQTDENDDGSFIGGIGQSLTYSNDIIFFLEHHHPVWAIVNIKLTYRVKRDDWQGDPCFPPAFTWEGLHCILSEKIPPRIDALNLSSSGLTGNLSSYFSNLNFLETLDLSNNTLIGLIPEFLADLPQLKYLNLAGNNFSGSIPEKLVKKAKSGLELRADTYHPCEKDRCNKNKKFIVPLAVSLTALSVILAIFIVTLMLRRRRNRYAKLWRLGHRKDGLNLENKSMQFSYSDILRMTNNFQRVLGLGGFGTVYHGATVDGKEVAVKLLSQSSTQGYKEFQTEAELLTRVHHRNLTILIGYCYEDTHMALVYEYMSRGNLKEHLSGKNNVLSWSERLRILLDSAQGLDYLHNGCKPPIIHRDIKSNNILINQNFEAKLADFGLSRAFAIDDGSYVTTRVVGTPGYLDPEYYGTQRLHEKSDIYSFGVVILEVITGRPVISVIDQDRRYIVRWVGYLLNTGDIGCIMDPEMRGVYDVNTAWKALEIAMACAAETSLERPNMAHVLAELKECFVAEKARSEGHRSDAGYLLEMNSVALEIEVGAR